MSRTILARQIDVVRRMQSREITGTVTAVRGLSVLVDDMPLGIGSLVRLDAQRNATASPRGRLYGEVVGFEGSRCIVMLLGSSAGVSAGMRVVAEPALGLGQTFEVGASLLGRVIDGLGRPLDGGRIPHDTVPRSLGGSPTSPLRRRPITEPLATGVAVIDAMLTVGRGQRVGVFSGPGVGKSTVLATIARNTAADVNVIALVGERGREVRDFIDNALGVEGLARSVVIVATGDEPPLLRVRAALAACAMAEHFRDGGSDVMLMMDSITRFAQAQRQIGLTVGEQPATRGYTPSVFAMLPVLLERAGAIEGGGSITGLYAVLVEGDDLTEPISDAARGILDGHLALSRKLASRGHYPAVDVLQSISRVADAICDERHIAARRTIINLLAAYAEAEELINIGAYARGSNAACDVAIALKPAIDSFLQQPPGQKAAYPDTCRRLIELAGAAQQEFAQRAAKMAGGSASQATSSNVRKK